MKSKRTFHVEMKLILILSTLFLSSALQAMPAQILLMRHAEKPLDGNELSVIGWQRAQALPELFDNRPEFKKYGAPVALYAMAPDHIGGSVRAIQTLKYVAARFNLPIQSNFTKNQVADLVSEIRNNPSYNNKLVVISWEHNVLTDIASALGAVNIPNWPGSQFDRVWLLNFQGNTLLNLQDLPEKLLPSDSNT